MPATTFKATNYLNRVDLEAAIKAVVGINAKDNKDAEHKITGKRADLKKLLLDDKKEVYGVKVVITDTPTAQMLADKLKK